jgi:hypothetical protein
MRRILALFSLLACLSACMDIPQPNKRRPARTSVVTPSPEARQCLANLGKTNAAFTPLADEYYGGGCSNINTVRLDRLRSDEGSLALSNLGPVTCPLASTFAAWARYGVDRAARQIMGSALVRIETMGSYACRNVSGSEKRSAHATASAIDVSAFILADGRRISVRGDWSEGSTAERQFLRVIHTSACKRFGTVLGPDYNAAHADHLHLERSSKAFCA